MTAGGNGEVGLIAVYDLEQWVLQGRLYAAIDHKFFHWEKRSPVILPLLSEEPEILFNLLIYALHLSIYLRVIYSHQLAIDTELWVQSFDEPGCKLRSSITDDTLWESVESEYVMNVEVRNAISINLICSKGEVCLLHV